MGRYHETQCGIDFPGWLFAERGNAIHPFPLSRIVCRTDWLADGRAFVANVIEFEYGVNDVWLRHDDVVICTYRLGQFSGETAIDIMRTHRMVIIGGILQRNPFIVSSEQFLPEFRARRAMRPVDVAV